MLWYVFVWFYLISDHASWPIIAVAAVATLIDIVTNAAEKGDAELARKLNDWERQDQAAFRARVEGRAETEEE